MEAAAAGGLMQPSLAMAAIESAGTDESEAAASEKMRPDLPHTANNHVEQQ